MKVSCDAMSLLQPLRRSAIRIVRWVVLLIIGVLLVPYIVTPLYRYVPPVSTPMLWRWLKGERVTRSFVPIGAMPSILPRTVIVAEDARFCSHSGIDWQELREAFEDADDLDAMRGGSTITQQTAKNLFLWPGRSLLRKGLEVPLALWIDLVLPKRRVLEIYLNIAEWGPNGEFGVEAGAQRAFGKSARDVSASEAARLAAVLPNPLRRSARQPRPGVRRIAGIHEARAAAAASSLDACVRSRGPTSVDKSVPL
jgi:monofunctional biosynthetic peptidoglycan transglycosylase